MHVTTRCLCRDYGHEGLCYIDSRSVYPPKLGWKVSSKCDGPPPQVSMVSKTGGIVLRSYLGSLLQQPGRTASHTWKPGQELGLEMELRGTNKEDPCGVCVSTISDPELREELRSKGVAPGNLDFVIGVQGKDVTSRSYNTVTQLINTAMRPLTLTFGEDPAGIAE